MWEKAAKNTRGVFKPQASEHDNQHEQHANPLPRSARALSHQGASRNSGIEPCTPRQQESRKSRESRNLVAPPVRPQPQLVGRSTSRYVAMGVYLTGSLVVKEPHTTTARLPKVGRRRRRPPGGPLHLERSPRAAGCSLFTCKVLNTLSHHPHAATPVASHRIASHRINHLTPRTSHLTPHLSHP